VLRVLTADQSIDAVVLRVSAALNLVTISETRAKFKSCIQDFCGRNPSKPVVAAVDGLSRIGA
jgi:hypothetical protein